MYLQYTGNLFSVTISYWWSECNVHVVFNWWCYIKCILVFIIYLQKIPLDTTYFPTQKYKIPYHATNVIFSVYPSYIFYPPRKNPAPDGGFWIRLAIWATTFVIIKIATLFNVSVKRLDQRNKIKPINTFSCTAVTCLLIVTSTKFWPHVVWHDVATSHHTVSILPFL